MIKRIVWVAPVLIAIACVPLFGQRKRQPDLKVRQFEFVPRNDKAVRVQVANYGSANAGSSVLRLTVRKIKGISVGRTIDANVSALAPGKGDWVLIDCTSILPKDVALKDTTFKLNVDATKLVTESNEANNETWHNGP